MDKIWKKCSFGGAEKRDWCNNIVWERDYNGKITITPCPDHDCRSEEGECLGKKCNCWGGKHNEQHDHTSASSSSHNGNENNKPKSLKNLAQEKQEQANKNKPINWTPWIIGAVLFIVAGGFMVYYLLKKGKNHGSDY